MRVLLDYRPALRERSGVGEYVFQLSRALLAESSVGSVDGAVDLTLFSSSWKDRVADAGDLEGAAIVDRRVPVRLLNFAWHRLEWPPAEALAGGRFDVAHSPHPLLMPARRAARVVTVHDLYFLTNPEHTRGEVRRDYAALARDHGQRADRILVPSRFTASEVEQRFGIPADRISVCPHGRPDWTPRTAPPKDGGYILFFGTLEPRKNVGGLLDAYEKLIGRVPDLILAGMATDAARPWLERIAKPPLAGRVRHVGYVDPAQRRQIYEGARLLVQPSFEEGFGFPVLEAMTLGVPVVAANRGALPELLGDAGMLVDPANADELAAAIDKMANDEAAAASCASRGSIRARQFDWRHTARCVRAAYQQAIVHRSCASA